MSDFVASVRLFHASGVAVTLPLGKSSEEYKNLYASVDAMIGAGFLTAEPVAVATVGEKKDTIGYVVRKEKINEKGTTPSLDLYVNHPQMVRSFITVYLNTPEEISHFESVSGLKLDSIRLYAGEDKLDRSTPKGQQYAKACAKPFDVVWIPNPKFDADAAAAAKLAGGNYFVPQKKFLRLVANAAPQQQGGTPTTNATPQSRQQPQSGGVDFGMLMQRLEIAGSDDEFDVAIEAIQAAWSKLTPQQKASATALQNTVRQQLAGAAAGDDNDPIPF